MKIVVLLKAKIAHLCLSPLCGLKTAKFQVQISQSVKTL
jgi:hypothetical protein